MAKVQFTCNICGTHTQCDESLLGREEASCHACGSTVRMRAIVHHVSLAVLGRSIPLTEFPNRPDIRGLGLSDWDGYAIPLSKCFRYTNTYYHCEPRLDITQVPDDLAGSCDFVISTDVFEHVCPPVSPAFEGARKLLKPGGTLVLTVPFMLEESETREHFPNLHEFEIVESAGGRPHLVNTRPDRSQEFFDDLIFHGGPGHTLEMRLFARDSLQRELEAAGFSNIRFDADPVPDFGIHWQHPWSIPIIARA